mmetsp:Transcript_34017/g.79560  ORF Transcript_34017/g.79560 Transcript_34017/m.79560 type:complete len:224 (+) Transcript_34017:67-738(+)
MTENDVFLTRHGSRIDKEDRGWMAKAGHSRSDDPHLSTDGEEQAAQLATKLANLHEQENLSHIVCSPFIRCVQTALPLSEALQLPIKIEPGICEILTTFPPGFLDVSAIKEFYPNRIDPSYEPVVKRGGLSREYSDSQAAGWAANAASEVRKRLEGRILFVGHGASCLGIAEAFGASDYVGYASLSRFSAGGAKTGPWRLVGTLGDVSHLAPKHQQTARSSAF